MILGFYLYFREHIPNFAEIAKPLTNLTAKRVAAIIPWRSDQQQTFDELKRLLCKATIEPLHVVDFSKPFHLCLPRWLSWLRHSVHRPGRSIGGAGVQFPGQPVDFVFGFQWRMLEINFSGRQRGFDGVLYNL